MTKTKPPFAAHLQKVREAGPENDCLVALLKNYGAARAERNRLSRDISSLSYTAEFPMGDALVTIWFNRLDWQTKAPVVITNITTLPDNKRKNGFGKAAIIRLLQWAQDSGLYEVRASQVGLGNEGFWVKCGFIKCPPPNPCNDFVWIPQPVT